MRQGAEFTKDDLDKLDNSQLITMTRQEARDAIDYCDDDNDCAGAIGMCLDYAQDEARDGVVTFVVIRIEG